jgi:hypothetical protein
MDPTSGNFPFGLAICHYWYWAWLICTISGTGRPISGTGLCHFQHGHSLGPVPELDSMRMVPFPVPGSASPVWSFLGSRTRTGIYVRGLGSAWPLSLSLCSWLTCARARKRKKRMVNAVPQMWFPTSGTGTITGMGRPFPVLAKGKLRVWVLTYVIYFEISDSWFTWIHDFEE